MANLSKLTIPVKNPSTGEISQQTYDLKGDTTAYSTNDAASSTIKDTDYVPMLEGDTRKKALWSTIMAKIKSAFGSAVDYNATRYVTSGSENLVMSGAVSSMEYIMSQNNAKNLYRLGIETQSKDGVTFTVDNGVITADTNGNTLESQVFLNLNGVSADLTPLPAGNYKLSGCPQSIGQFCQLSYIINNQTGFSDIGAGAEVTLDGTETIAYARLYINPGANGIYVFKPMITIAGQPNSDYAHFVPYAKTNKELTEEVKAAEEDIESLNTSIGALESKVSIASTAKLTIKGNTDTVHGTTFKAYLSDMQPNEVRVFVYYSMTNDEKIGTLGSGLCIAVRLAGLNGSVVQCIAAYNNNIATQQISLT